MTEPAPGRIRRFWAYLRPFAAWIVALGASTLLSVLVGLPTPWLEKVIIDEAIPRADRRLLALSVGSIAALFVLYRLVLLARSWLSVRVRQRVLTAVRMDMYAHLLGMSQRFFARHPAGALLSRITSDVGQVQNVLADELLEVIASGVKLAVSLGLLLAISARLTWMCAAVLPVVGAVYLLLKRRVYARSLELQESQARLSARVQQAFAGMKVIQAEVVEQRMRDQTLEASRELERVGIRREMVGVAGNFLTTVLSYVPLLAVLWGLGAWMVIERSLTLGALLAFTQYLFGLVGPVTRFFQFNLNLQAGYAALDRVYEILDERADIADAPDARPLAPPIASIELDRVDLAFAAGDSGTIVHALRNVSFSIAPGQKVALVGPSGAGKSSILNLLLRFHDPSAGEVRLNGRPLSDYSLSSLRRQVAWLPQEVFLFATTVHDNVTLGRAACARDVARALERAAADELVAAERGGADAVVGEQGANLSGGQRQRVAMARAMLKDASLVLLDEPTAALDAATERRVLRGMRAWLEGRSAVIVSHRLPVLELADRILVLAQGRVVEQGTREQLLERGGVFCALSRGESAEGEGGAGAGAGAGAGGGAGGGGLP
jgi:subfamily B ATP-binding cassette protein MsbA